MKTSIQITTSAMVDDENLDYVLRKIAQIGNGYATVAPIAGYAGFTAVLQSSGDFTIENISDGNTDRIDALIDSGAATVA